MAKLLITLSFLMALGVLTICSGDRRTSYSKAKEVFPSPDDQARRCKGFHERCRSGECCTGFLCDNYDKTCQHSHMGGTREIFRRHEGTHMAHGPGLMSDDGPKNGHAVASTAYVAAEIPVYQKAGVNVGSTSFIRN